MDITKLSKESLKEMQSQIEKELKTRDDCFVLKHEVKENGDINFYFKNEMGFKKSLGFILETGVLRILTVQEYIDNYKVWREHGQKVDTFCVTEWKGGRYIIDKELVFTKMDIKGSIYSFEYCICYPDCRDKNIQRMYGCNTPINF